MRILFLISAYNGLSQRMHVELLERGHEVSVELSLSPDVMREAIALYEPDLLLCPFLKDRIPEDIWSQHVCIVLHPGIKGDRGPSALDWAILNGEQDWGVTALQAVKEMDAGDIWSSRTFPMREATKASIYRHEVTEAAVEALLEAVARCKQDDFAPEPLYYSKPDVRGELRPYMRQHVREIDWTTEKTAEIVRKINMSDSSPGLLDEIGGMEVYLYGAHPEAKHLGEPGEVIARRHGAICRATVDGAVWISHLRRRNTDGQSFFKLPAADVLGERVADVPEAPIDVLYTGTEATFREIWYEERDQVGYLHFDFYNGAMSTEQCRRLTEAYRAACERSTKVIVLLGGTDFWSNGIHLNTIEAADDPAEESWRNINAIDDLIEAMLTTRTHQTVAAVHGNAGAGGVIFALAADHVWVREGVVLNPYYKTMGLYGSEYWTYLLPKRVGQEKALELTEACMPVGTVEAERLGLVDEVISARFEAFEAEVARRAAALAAADDFEERMVAKLEAHDRDEREKPLAAYREEELARMWQNFFGDDSFYHEARSGFVHKVAPEETPARLSLHRYHTRRYVA